MARGGEGVNDGNKRKANEWGPVIKYGSLAWFLLMVWKMQPCACMLGRECIHAHINTVWQTLPHKRGEARPQTCSGMNEWKWLHFLLHLTIKCAILWPLLHNNASCFSRHDQPGEGMMMVYESLWGGHWCLCQLCHLWSLTASCPFQKFQAFFDN